jgi:predicted nucleic acid-binding protein
VKQSATFDSSFWINAHRSGLLPHILDRYDVTYCREVAAELDPAFPSGAEFWRLVGSTELRETNPIGVAINEFGRGERAAISLAVENHDWTLLIDDHRPFQAAARLGLNAVCTPVLAVVLYSEKRLGASEALVVLARLAALQTISPALIAAALAQLGRSLSTGRGG